MGEKHDGNTLYSGTPYNVAPGDFQNRPKKESRTKEFPLQSIDCCGNVPAGETPYIKAPLIIGHPGYMFTWSTLVHAHFVHLGGQARRAYCAFGRVSSKCRFVATKTSSRGKILVCTASNGAVDEILTRVSQKGLIGTNFKL